jgi:phage tail sheath protein FI
MATTQRRTPGVYINEPDSFPPSIVGVGTAVPAFIGYTQKGPLNEPVAIQSMVDFLATFGGAYLEQFYLSKTAPVAPDRSIGSTTLGGVPYFVVESPAVQFNLYASLQLFFANGGSDCFVVSCGSYGTAPPPIKSKDLIAGLNAVKDLVGPTMLAIPDAVLLDSTPSAPPLEHPTYADTVNAMLKQCLDRQDRVAVIDVLSPQPPDGDPIEQFRAGVGSAVRESRRYGMAYYPYVMTSLMQPTDLTVASLSSNSQQYLDDVAAALTAEADTVYKSAPDRYAQVVDYIGDLKNGTWVPDGGPPQPPVVPPDRQKMTATQLTNTLTASLPALLNVFALIADSQNVMPPSGAICGLYALTDRNSGVWNAPANAGLANVTGPRVLISDTDQGDLNMPISGLAVNAIRTFVGRGTLVWGARTLDGNSNDWRYIQVRRTMIMIEQSIKQALNQMVFAPNTAQTWVTTVSMIESFLHGIWAAGGLAGPSADKAYTVQCGLGVTMTAEDILNGYMIVNVTLAMVHPAEFIELYFKQQMQAG